MAPIVLAALLAVPSVDTTIGRWRSPTRNGIIDIQPCGASICGTLVTSDGIAANPGLTDGKNKDAALRKRPVKGLTILSGFTRDGGDWNGGSIYSPDDGGTYHARITPVDADHLALRGCIVWPLCKTETWTRVR